MLLDGQAANPDEDHDILVSNQHVDDHVGQAADRVEDHDSTTKFSSALYCTVTLLLSANLMKYTLKIILQNFIFRKGL